MSDKIIINKKRMKHFIVILILYTITMIGAGLFTLWQTGNFFIGFFIATLIVYLYPLFTDYRDWINKKYPKENTKEED